MDCIINWTHRSITSESNKCKKRKLKKEHQTSRSFWMKKVSWSYNQFYCYSSHIGPFLKGIFNYTSNIKVRSVEIFDHLQFIGRESVVKIPIHQLYVYLSVPTM